MWTFCLMYKKIDIRIETNIEMTQDFIERKLNGILLCTNIFAQIILGATFSVISARKSYLWMTFFFHSFVFSNYKLQKLFSATKFLPDDYHANYKRITKKHLSVSVIIRN